MEKYSIFHILSYISFLKEIRNFHYVIVSIPWNTLKLLLKNKITYLT